MVCFLSCKIHIVLLVMFHCHVLRLVVLEESFVSNVVDDGDDDVDMVDDATPRNIMTRYPR